MKKIFSIVLYLLVAILVGVTVAYAGSLTPPGSPAKTMKSLSDLYQLINTGANTPSIDFTTPSTISSTMNSLGDTYDLMKTKISDIDVSKILTGTTIFGKPGTAILSLGDAAAGNVLAGKYFSNATTANVLGTMTDNTSHADFTPAATDVSIPTGFYDGVTKISGDADLVTGNIKAGVNIFGVAGTLITSPTYGDNDPTKVLNTATNPGTFDPNTISTYNTSNLSIGTVKSGTAFGNSLTGEYPSVTYPLPGDTGAGDAVDSNILSGLEAWTKAGTLITGTMPTQTLSPNNDTVSAGYYNATTLSAIDTDLISANILSGKTIFGIAGKTEVVDTTEASVPIAVGTVLSGKKGFVNGALITGTMVNKVGTTTVITPSTADQAIAQGYYSGVVGDGKVSGDANLVTGNIKSGITIFGVAGKTSVVDTADATAVASQILGTYTAYVNGAKITGILKQYGLPKTGQTTSYGTGSDGNIQAGIDPAYTDNSDGTLTDNATGLVWQKQNNNTAYILSAALAYCNANTAALPGSGWRLPNIKELYSIIDYSRYNPMINPLFTNTKSDSYWSSTTMADNTAYAWPVFFATGYVGYGYDKGSGHYVRCVRG